MTQSVDNSACLTVEDSMNLNDSLYGKSRRRKRSKSKKDEMLRGSLKIRLNSQKGRILGLNNDSAMSQYHK